MRKYTEEEILNKMYTGEEKRDASSKISGFIYQDLIAIEKMLDKETECVATEFLEDITYIKKDELYIAQVKHYPKTTPKLEEIVKDLYYQFLRYTLLGGNKKAYLQLIIHHKSDIAKPTEREVQSYIAMKEIAMTDDKKTVIDTVEVLNKYNGYNETSYKELLTELEFFSLLKKMGNNVVKTKEASVIEFEIVKDLSELKEIYDILDLVPCLNEELIVLAKNMHEYYFSLYITCLLTMIPQALRIKYDKIFVTDNMELLPFDVKGLFKNNQFKYETKYKEYLPTLQRLVKEGKIRLLNVISDKANIKEESYLKLNAEYNGKLNVAQQEIVDFVKSYNEPISRGELIEKFSVGRVGTLIEKGALIQFRQEVIRHFDEGKSYEDKLVTLNEKQQKVYESIKEDYDSFNTILLHGITGSGKTEIYLACIEDIINKGKTAIMLVPEISLTPQIVARFKARFKDNVAVLHSRLSISASFLKFATEYLSSGEIKPIK